MLCCEAASSPLPAGCFHNLHLKKLSKPFFLSVQLAVNVPGALCSADFFKAVFFPQTVQTCSETVAMGMDLRSSSSDFHRTCTWRSGAEQVWAAREGHSALSASVAVWVFVSDGG